MRTVDRRFRDCKKKMLASRKPFPSPPCVTKEAIAALREEMGVTKSKFAGLLGVSTRTLFSWENGTKVPLAAQKLMRQAQTFFASSPKKKSK